MLYSELSVVLLRGDVAPRLCASPSEVIALHRELSKGCANQKKPDAIIVISLAQLTGKKII